MHQEQTNVQYVQGTCLHSNIFYKCWIIYFIIIHQHINTSIASAHQQHQCIRIINASAASAHQQHQQHQRISSISKFVALMHQQQQGIRRIYSNSSLVATIYHQHFSSISVVATSTHKQHQCISSNIGSATILHEQDQRISSISILAASVICNGRDIYP